MKRAVIGFLVVVVAIAGVFTSPGVVAQDEDDYEATIEAYQTDVAELKGTVTARGKKINVQRTQIAELQENVPPTNTPAPDLSGKEAYSYVGDPYDVFTRPFDYIGHKMQFCGTVLSIQVARPGQKFPIGDTTRKSFSNVVQITVDGTDVQFIAGYNGDTRGIIEGSYVCAWGTLIDTFTGRNRIGGTIQNPVFEAEFLELV